MFLGSAPVSAREPRQGREERRVGSAPYPQWPTRELTVGHYALSSDFIVASLLVLVVVGSLVIRRRRTAPRFLAGVEPGFFFEVRDEVSLCCSTARELSSRGDAWLMIEGTVEGLDLDGIETQSWPPEGLGHHTICS